MSFSLSTFAVDIDRVPTVAFQAKWQADAEQICRDWLHAHWDELTESGPGGVELPPIFKLRLARTSEREAYEVGGTGFEFCGVIKVVNLVKNVEHPQTEVESSEESASIHDAEDGNGHDAV